MRTARLTAVIILSTLSIWAVSMINRPVQAAPAYRPAAAPPWNTSVRVNDTAAAGPVARSAPAFAATDSMLYAVWQDARNDDGDIYSAQSANAGQTWTYIVRVNDDAPGREQADPDVAVNAAGTLHTVWEDTRSGWREIYYARSTDGRLWSNAIRISTPGSVAVDPAIAVYTNTVCAAWADSTGVRAACSTDNGVNWGSILTAPDVDGQTPDLVVDSTGQVQVVWSDTRNGPRDIYYARWSGSSWSAATRLNTDAGSAVQQYPSLALNGNVLIAGWQDNRSGAHIYARYSSNTGSTWSASDAQVSDAGNVSGAPALTTARGEVWATWVVLSGSTYIAYADTGRTVWGTDAPISTTTQARQDIAAAGNASYVWAGWAQDNAIWNAARSTAWGSVYQVSNAGEATQLYPALGAANNGDLFAIWNDNRSTPGLYTARSTDGGISWGTNHFVSGSVDAGQPALAVTGTQTLHGAWRQEDYDYWRIYYNRSVDGGSTWLTARAVVSYLQEHRPETGVSPQVESPEVAVLGNNVYVSWAAGSGLYLAKSTDGGSTWGTPTNVFTQVGGSNVMASGKVALRTTYAGGEVVVLAWTNGHTRTCSAFSTDGGSTWPQRTCFDAGSATYAQNPAVALTPGSGQAVVAWQDNRDGAQRLYRAIWESSGVVVRNSGLVTEAAGPVAFPAVLSTIEGVTTVVHLAWQDARNGDDDIYWARSTDGGLNWQAAVRVNDDTGAYPQQRPVLANNVTYSATKVWTAWQDFRRSNWDIYATTITRTCDVPLTGVGISGPTSAWVNQPVVLTSIITPANASLPIWYEWRNPPNPMQTTSSATYTWSTYGDQVVTLTASSCSAFSKVQPVRVRCSNPLTSIYFPVPAQVQAGQLFTLTAVTTPVSPDLPLEVQWSPEPESGQGTLQPQYRLTTVGSVASSVWVTATALNCGGTWGGADSYQHSILVTDYDDPQWSNPQPAPNAWVTQTLPGNAVPFSITVQDSGSGLKVDTAEAAFSTDSGATWSSWQPISISGSNGARDPQLVSGSHVFGVESGTTHRNRVKYRIADMAGNTSPDEVHWIDVDTVRPTNLVITWTDRPTGTWASDLLLDVCGAAPAYDASGTVVNYYVMTQSPATSITSTAGSNWGGSGACITNIGIPDQGQGWYLHLRAIDPAGWWSTDTVHVGPFWLDYQVPGPPEIIATDPITGWTTDNTVTVRWTHYTPDTGSEITGYSFAWDNGSGVEPDNFVDYAPHTGSEYYTTSLPMSNYTLQNYFKVKARDAAGNWGWVRSVGPWKIDQTAPQAPISGWADQAIDTWSQANTIVMTWPRPSDGAGSGVDAYSFVWTTTAGIVPDTTPEITSTNATISATSGSLADGQWFFYVRARDAAGNWSAPAQYGRFYVDRTPPAAPVIEYSSHITNVWSTDDTIAVRWIRPSDSGSPIGAYSYLWNRAPTTLPDTTPEHYSSNSPIATTSDPLLTGDDYYFHVRARDAALNWGATTHLGPFKIDAPPPLLLVDHGSGGPGSDVMVTGLVFPADSAVTVWFTSTTGTVIKLGDTQSSFDGTFQVLATVPVTATENADYYFAATSLTKSARTPFHVTPGMAMSIQPASVKIRDGATAPTVTVHLGNLNPNAAVVIETDWNTFKGPYPLNGNTDLIKSVTVPKSTISGTHTLTATARVAGVAVQRAAATFSVTWQTVNLITESFISLHTIQGERGAAFTVHGHNSWVNAVYTSDDNPDVEQLCPPNYEEIGGVHDFTLLPEEYGGCPVFDGFHLEFDHRESGLDTVEVYGSGYFEGRTHVPDGWFDARTEGRRWPVETEVPWGTAQVCLVARITGKFPDFTDVLPNGQTIHHTGSPWSEEFDITCAPFEVEPPTPTFSAQYKLMTGNVPVPLNKSPRIIVDGRSVGERGAAPPTVMATYTTTNVNTPIAFTVPEGSYYVSAYACNYQPVQGRFTRGRGDQGLTPIPMTYTPYAGPAVEKLEAGLQTLLSSDQPDRIGPLLSLSGVPGAPSVDLPIIIEQPGPGIAEVTAISATINGIQPYSISSVSNNRRTAKWNASQLPPGELTLLVQLKGHYLTDGASDCGTTDSWGPVSRMTVVMAAPPPWLTGPHTNLTALSYDAATRVYHMAGRLKYGVDINENADLGFLGTLYNYLLAATDVWQDFDLNTGAWHAQATVRGGVSLMCLTSLMGDCAEDYTLNLVAEPIGNTIRGAGDTAYPDRYSSTSFKAYEYNIEPIEVYNGIIASYWGIVNVHLSINFGAGARLDIAPGLEADFAPNVTFTPQANINVPISLWVDILLGAASAGVDAIPSVTLAMPVTLDTSGAQVSGPDVCFRLTGRVWVEVLFWDASFGPFELYQAGECALHLLREALMNTTPPPSTLPAPALATDGFGHVLGAWVHNDSNHPAQNQGKLYTVYFDGANWGAQQAVAGDANLLVTDPAIAFAGENEAVAVFASNAPNNTQPLTWTTVTQQLSNQKVSYSVYTGTSWTAPATLATGGGPHGRVTITGDPYRGRAIAMWIHDATGGGSIKRWFVMYSVYDAETNTWSTPANVDETPSGSLDAEVSLAFDSTGKATAIWVRQAGVEASSVITSPFTKNHLRTLVTANWHPNEPDVWAVDTQPTGLPVGALMPDIAFDDNDHPVVAYALHQKDRDGQTATGLGNNAYLGYAVGAPGTIVNGPDAAPPYVWTAKIVPGVKGVEQPRVAMLPDDQALVTYRGFGAAGTADYAGVLMGSTIDLREASDYHASHATAMINGNSWLNDVVATRTRADGTGALEPRLFTAGAFNLGGQAASVRMSGASVRQISLAGADPVMLTQAPILPDLAIAPDDVVLSETLPVSGTLVPYTLTVRNLGLARSHQPVVVELIQDPGSPHETLIATGTVPIDLMFNDTYALTGTWQATSGLHVWLARLKPPIDDDIDGDNNEATITIGMPLPPDQLVGKFDGRTRSAGLSWLPVTGAALSGYRIYRAGGAGDWELLAETPQTAYADNTLQSGVTYRYAVSAISTVGVGSPLSNEITLGAQALYLPLLRR